MEENNNRVILVTPTLFSFDECVWYLDRGYDECLYQIEDNKIVKALVINGQPTLFEIKSENDALIITILSDNINKEIKQHVKNQVIEWFDLGRDLAPFYKKLSKQTEVTYMTEDFKGLHLMGIPDLFEAICWCIIGQQINLTFAYRIKRRLVEKYGNSVQYQGKSYYMHPTPETLLKVSVDEMKELQLSTSKANYLHRIATAFATGSLSKEQLASLTTLEQKQAKLMAIKGVGLWTANYTLMKCLKNPNCIPYGDAGLLNALIQHKIIESKTDKDSIDRYFDQFDGWKSYLTLYLWRSLAVKG